MVLLSLEHYYISTCRTRSTSRAVKKRGGGGGGNLGYLKKRGAQLQAASGGALEDNVVPG